jgi:hypothetical protein
MRYDFDQPIGRLSSLSCRTLLTPLRGDNSWALLSKYGTCPVGTEKSLGRHIKEPSFRNVPITSVPIRTLLRSNFAYCHREHNTPNVFLLPTTTSTQSATAAIKSLSQKPLGFFSVRFLPILSGSTSYRPTPNVDFKFTFCDCCFPTVTHRLRDCFLAHVTRSITEDPQSIHARTALPLNVFKHFTSAYLATKDIHSLTSTFDTETRKIVLFAYFHTIAALKEQEIDCPIPKQPESALLAAALSKKASIYALFEGQGTNGVYFDELQSLHDTYIPFVVPFVQTAFNPRDTTLINPSAPT